MYAIYGTINIPQMLAYIPYMDPMGNGHLVAFPHVTDDFPS